MSEAEPVTTVQVYLGRRTYEIVIVSDRLQDFADYLETWSGERYGATPDGGKVAVVTDANCRSYADRVAHDLGSRGWTVQTLEVEPGEASKQLDVAAKLFDELIDFQADRRTVVVAVGGGVVGDLAGFVAATYARGVPFVQVPTSLLADVDSSVGGKVAVNHPRGKNMIGAFYQPLGVFIDTSTLQTLPDREYRCGLAEVVKYGVILNSSFFVFLETHVADILDRDPKALRQIVARCCRLKADVVEQDEEERGGLRAVLNYGHTFAHAFESLAGYGTLLHGEAVAVGMACASRLAERLGRIGGEITRRQVDLLTALGLPTELPDGLDFSADEVLDRMRLDKKVVDGRLRMVLPGRLGRVQTVEVDPDDVRAVLSP